MLLGSPVETLELTPADTIGGFERLRAFLVRHAARCSAGWLGYDLRDDVEPVARAIADDFETPVLSFTAYADEQRWRDVAVAPPPAVPVATGLRAHCTRAEYEARVATVVEHIRAGDIFQANLTQPFSARFDGDPRALFWRLCAVSPAPFAAYIEGAGGTCVLSSSPEEFLHVEGRHVRTRPIKGTRPRGRSAAQDTLLSAELLGSAKDRAELAMIVDLLRNDLGKVAETGSVRVGPFPELATHAQVHHLFAAVQATLREDVDLVGLLQATFPGGSITGAPKLRCMQILEQLEWARRGVYTGAIGTIGPGPALHLNVAIRTIVYRDGWLRFNVGGGVTARSDPAAEYDESMHKAAGILAALGLGA